MVNQYWIPVVAIAGWVLIHLYRMYLHNRRREMVHRERLAMIERGIAPPPETDPAKFERLTGLEGPFPAGFRHELRAGRSRRAGMVLMGVGVGLGWLLAFTADSRVGLGVGGMVFILGLVFFLIAALEPDVSAATRSSGPPNEPWFS